MRGEGPAGATVLVVDDTLVNRLALSRGVEAEGHRVRQAADGRAALAVLAAEAVDMVLLDLLMPEVDGFEVLQRMRSDARLRDIPVLVISSVEETDDVARAIQMGAIDCLPKPFDPVLLRVRLRTALEQTRLRRMEQDYLRQELALRQQERLAMLGRLSAGLGHELNNPAAAALSTARQLRQELARAERLIPALVRSTDAEGLLAAVDTLLADVPVHAASGRGGGDAAALEQVLERLGVAQPWDAAEELAELGAPGELVARHLGGAGEGATLALDWFRSRARVRRQVASIIESVERMTGLTAALRGYSYLDRAPQQDVDVRRGLDDTLTMLGHKLPAEVLVERGYAPELAPIHAFGGQLNQVWTNLVDNAIAAVGERGRIAVRAFPGRDGVVVEVEDDGPGIPPELQRRVFDPFVTTKPPGLGTGLGLSISQQIVTEVHGGRMTVASAPGRTVFRVELPVMPPTPEAPAAQVPPAQAPAGEASYER